jgi:hypothetical protein
MVSNIFTHKILAPFLLAPGLHLIKSATLLQVIFTGAMTKRMTFFAV